MLRFLRITILVIVATSLSNIAYGRIILVREHFDYIRDAIEYANNGDTISCQYGTPEKPETYLENINFLGKNILVANRSYLEGHGDPMTAVIDGQDAGSVVTFNSGETQNAILKGFTIQNGTGCYNPNGNGGGIYCFQSSPRIENNIIKDNWDDTFRGGGIAIIGDESNPDITRPIISNNVIRNNKVIEIGGGIFYEYSKPKIINNEILRDSAYYGGGIGVFFDPSGSYNWTEINGNQIDSNEAYRGRALYFEESDAIIRNNTIRHNNYPNPQYNTGIVFPATVDFGDADGITGPGYNWIEDNGSYDINSSGDGLLAEGNYWVTLNTPDIRDRIYPGSGSIDFDPIAASDRYFSVTDNSFCETDVIVTGDLTVNSGVALTITPGKTFMFDTTDDSNSGIEPDLCEFIINGKLKAIGTESDTISFIPPPELPPPGDYHIWYGIRLMPNSIDSFDYCKIRYTYSGIHAENSNVTVYHSLIESNQVAGIISNGSQFTKIENCDIKYNGIYGIVCDQSAPIIRANHLFGNGIYGIRLGTTDWAYLARNQINAYPAHKSLDGVFIKNGGVVTIDTNWIEGHGQSGIYCYAVNEAKMRKNTIRENAYYGILCTRYSSPYVRWCWIGKNKTGVHCDDYSYPDLGTIEDWGCNCIDTSNYYWVANFNPEPQESIKAEYNWWGVPDPTQLASWKFIGLVDYEPWFPAAPEEGGQSANIISPSPTFALYAPKPNPAKREVRIVYSLPNRCKSELIICDAAGRIITKTTEENEPGHYEYLWHGKDQRGKEVPNGIYFVRLKAENNLQTQKITLTR